MRKASKTEWAYVAAMMDGEGSFSITKTTLHTENGKPYFGYDCKIMVSNTSIELMKWLVDHFGGSYRCSVKHISAAARANGQKSMRPCYRWTVERYERQEKFLLGILPYLVIKREQANLALQWTRMIQVKDPILRLSMHQQMIALNKGLIPEANTPDTDDSVKIESDLHGDMQSALTVM